MSAPIAALAMYDWPEVSAANDALWAFLHHYLAGRGIDAPGSLLHDRPYHEPWRSPDLLLAQTCGYPYATELRTHVQLVATPAYAAEGCQGTDYCSLIIAGRASGIQSLAGIGAATAAVNSAHSHSGYWAFRAAIARDPAAPPPRRAVLSGGHRQSLALVADGTAGLASIDAVCWALALRHQPDAAAEVRIIARSPMAPGLPLICAASISRRTVGALRDGLQAMMRDPALAPARDRLLLSGLDVLPDTAYDRILELRDLALAKPFPGLEGGP